MRRQLLSAVIAALAPAFAVAQGLDDAIVNGVPWYDQRDSVVSAHGANIIEDGGRYYMFGEYKTDSANVFSGFSCYSSPDLVNWRFERIALPPQPDGLMGPGRVGERPKVLRCPQTGEYVMLMHSDNLGYRDPCVAYATSPTVDGEYTMRGPLLYKGQPVRKWDIGSFADDDGHAYLLVHHGYIYRLAPDFHSLDSCIMGGLKGAGESPVMFKKGGTYFWLSSHTTSWERNDNMYHTSRSLADPWTGHGAFCPEGTLTHNSQVTFVLPLYIDGDTVPMVMGDRWSFPRQRSAATYVWMPAEVSGDSLSIPQLWQAWNPRTARQTDLAWRAVDSRTWESDSPTDTLRTAFSGTRFAVMGTQSPDGGYALVSIRRADGTVQASQLVDFYAKVPSTGLRYVSPVLPAGQYTAEIVPTGFSPTWNDKSRRQFGSTGTFVRITETAVY